MSVLQINCLNFFIIRQLTIINLEHVVASWQLIVESCTLTVVDAAVKFSEAWQCRGTHPDNQILVLESVVVRILRIKFPQLASPSNWSGESLQSYKSQVKTNE